MAPVLETGAQASLWKPSNLVTLRRTKPPSGHKTCSWSLLRPHLLSDTSWWGQLATHRACQDDRSWQPCPDFLGPCTDHLGVSATSTPS